METLVFIGLGNMGMPMALNLVEAGYNVYGVNRSKGKEEQFAAQGGKTTDDLQDIIPKADVIMTCLPLPADVEKVLLGEDGIFPKAKKGTVIIDFSTVSPSLSERLYEEGQKHELHVLDAPVSGGTVGAETGSLAVMVGGDQVTFEKVKPLLDVVGGAITYAGEAGHGTKVKLLNQYMVGMHTTAVSEMMNLVDKSGMDKELVYSVLSNGFAQSKIYDRHYKSFIAEDNYDPGFALELLHKDLSLVDEMAETTGATLSFGNQVTEFFNEAKSQHYGSKDMSALYPFLKEKDSRS